MNLSRELIEEIDSYVEIEIRRRLWHENGGANTDYENFCNEKDMNWIREEINSSFDYIAEYMDRPYSLSEEEFEEAKESRDFERYVERKRQEIEEEIDSIENSLGLHKIYDHIVNEVENRRRYKTAKEALENLERVLLEKKVIYDIEELEEEESYQKAKAYAASQDKN